MTTQIYCIRKIEFDAAHRVIGHENKCKYLHGHRYVLEARFKTEQLDHLGRVIDFGQIKQILGDWIDENWDHTAILSKEDQPLGEAIATITGQKIFYLNSNPTAENMALYLLQHICPKLFPKETSGCECQEITLHETPNCSVSVL